MIQRSLEQIQESLLRGDTTLEAMVRGYLTRIDSCRELNIYVEVYRDEALSRARMLDAKISGNPEELGRMFGAVVSIKDVLCVADAEVTAASGILKGFRSTFSATAVARAVAEDVILIGRTNCDEFAMGSTNENSIYGPTLNGLDPSRVPGGSSGAAAVSVQQDTCLLALGSDTGGSVRQPAAYCGIVGFKPTYGRISRYGLIAYASSFDQIGILGHHVKDVHRLLQVIEGQDPMDATSSARPATSDLSDGRRKTFRLCYFPEVMEHPALDKDISAAFNRQLEGLRDNGHLIRAEQFGLMKYLVPAYYVLTTAEASSNLSRYDGIRYGQTETSADNLHDLIVGSRSAGFGLEVKRRIMMGTFVLSVGYFDAYFLKAQKVRKMIKEQVDRLLEEYDFLLMPTTTGVAPRLGDALKNPVEMYLSDVYTVLANLGGYPAVALPMSMFQSSLPHSFQIIAKPFDEGRLLQFAQSVQNMA